MILLIFYTSQTWMCISIILMISIKHMCVFVTIKYWRKIFAFCWVNKKVYKEKYDTKVVILM